MNIWMIGNNVMEHHYLKKIFYSHLNMDDITGADYAQSKRVFKDFEMKNLGEYNDLYVQSDTLLLVDLLENFRNMSLEIYEVDSGKFLSAPGLPWQAALKNTEAKLDLIGDIDVLLMVEKGIKEEYVSLFINMQKLITNTWKIMTNKESSYLIYWGVKNYNEESDKGYFLQFDVKCIEKLHEFHNMNFIMIYHFKQKE